MNQPPLRVGTRGSDLALWQAETVQDLLTREAPMRDVELEIVKTTGDVVTDRPIDAIGRTAVFTAELDEALADGRVDLAVHSLKDVETRLHPGQVLAAVLPRGPVEDVLLGGKTLEELPEGARVGTGSVRRRAQIARQRPDLQIMPIRGNVPTRLRKLADGDYDALVMARAGLVRLGFAHEISQVFGPDIMMPAVGQGAVCVTCREDDEIIRRILSGLNHPLTAQVVGAERACMAAIGGGCNVPLGVNFTVREDRFFARAGLFSLDGKDAILVECEHPADADPVEIGEDVASALKAEGGDELVVAFRDGDKS